MSAHLDTEQGTPEVTKQAIYECSATAIVELTACQHMPSNSSWNACWLAGDLASVTCSAALTHASLMRVVCCHMSSVHMEGRDSCSTAMALGVAQQHEHDTHADEHKCVRELEHTRAVKCGILTEVVPHKHHGDNSPHTPHGSERGLQHEKLKRGSDFQGNEAGVCEAYVDGGGKGSGKGWATLAREAECEGVWCAGVGDREGGVVQQSHKVSRGHGGHKSKARVWGAVRSGGI